MGSATISKGGVPSSLLVKMMGHSEACRLRWSLSPLTDTGSLEVPGPGRKETRNNVYITNKPFSMMHRFEGRFRKAGVRIMPAQMLPPGYQAPPRFRSTVANKKCRQQAVYTNWLLAWFQLITQPLNTIHHTHNSPGGPGQRSCNGVKSYTKLPCISEIEFAHCNSVPLYTS